METPDIHSTASLPVAFGRHRLSTSWLIRIGIAFVSLLTASWLLSSPPGLYVSANETLRDQLIRLAVSEEPEERIAIIDIDEESVGATQPWPWQRALIADLVDTLITEYFAKSVAIDMVMPSKADKAGDERLAALAKHGLLVTSVAFDFVQRESPVQTGHLAGGRSGNEKLAAALATGYVGNHEGLASARCTGNIGFTPDADGVLRRMPLYVRHLDRHYPALALALLDCGELPDLAEPYWRIPYRKRAEAFTAIPAGAILNRSAPIELVRGRYVLIGSSALGLSDRVATPLGPSDAGVMVHAQALSTLLDIRSGMQRIPWPASGLAFLWVGVALLLALFLVPKRSAWQGSGLLVVWMALWFPVAFGAVRSGSEFSVLLPPTIILFLLVTVIPLEWWVAQSNARRIMQVFEHYVSPSVLEELVMNQMAGSLELRQLEVTVLIADIENYTGHTSRLALAEAAALTRSYLDAMTQPVLETGGTLDKYTGDGLVAFWGAPIQSPDQADRAILAGESILERVAGLNETRLAKGLPAVRVRIGIESGMALVGDLGTTFRSTYTAVGDCINFASKLQEAARDFDASLIIGPGTRARSGRTDLVELGQAAIRGSSQPMAIATTSRVPSP